MSAALVLDPRQLEMRVRDLTKPLSLRQASPSRYVEREEPTLSTSAEAHVVLDRIQEMEQRQQFFEALLGGAGPDTEELESIRYKRMALEESQVALEQELKQVRRKMRTESSGLVQVHNGGQRKTLPCTNCSKLGIERTRLEGMELALQVKERELQAKIHETTANEKRMQEQKRQIAVAREELAAERDKFLRMKSAGGETRNGTEDGNLAQREIALMRQKHEVTAARNQQQAELRTLEASRKALQEERRILEATRQQERQTRLLKDFSSSEKATLLREKREVEAERRRLNEDRNELNSERRVLEANFRVLEAQRRDLNEAQIALENQNESKPKKWCFPLCCFS